MNNLNAQINVNIGTMSVDQIKDELQHHVSTAIQSFVQMKHDGDLPRMFPEREPRFNAKGKRMKGIFSMRQRYDDIVWKKIGVGEAQGDCMLPYCIDGDVFWFDFDVRPTHGDLVIAQAMNASKISGDSFMEKVLLKHCDRWILASMNEPPLLLDGRLKVVGVTIASMHYQEAKPRSTERQAMFDQEAKVARARGYAWSLPYLKSVFGPIDSTTRVSR